MTYRSDVAFGAAPLRGLGDAQLTDPMLASISKSLIAAGGCTDAIRKSVDAIPCLPPAYVQWFGRCLSGPTPAGLTDLEWAGGCVAMANCGAFAKLGCPADAPAYPLPDCMTPEMQADLDPVTSYCRSNPTFQGSDRQKNAACWGFSRYPDFYQRMMNIPACAAPVVTPTVTTAPSADTPTMVPVDPVMPGGDSSTWAPAPAGMSGTTMAVLGIGAVLALGLGYKLLKK